MTACTLRCPYGRDTRSSLTKPRRVLGLRVAEQPAAGVRLRVLRSQLGSDVATVVPERGHGSLREDLRAGAAGESQSTRVTGGQIFLDGRLAVRGASGTGVELVDRSFPVLVQLDAAFPSHLLRENGCGCWQRLLAGQGLSFSLKFTSALIRLHDKTLDNCLRYEEFCSLHQMFVQLLREFRAQDTCVPIRFALPSVPNTGSVFLTMAPRGH